MTQFTENECWDHKIKEIEREVNNAENKIKRYTSFELLHGYRPKFHDEHYIFYIRIKMDITQCHLRQLKKTASPTYMSLQNPFPTNEIIQSKLSS